MRPKREETEIEVSIYEGLTVLQEALSPEQLSVFSKAANIHRIRLVKAISREEGVTMSTLLKFAVFMQFLGIATLFERLDERSKLLITLYAVSGKGIEFFFENPNLRDAFVSYARGKRNFQAKVQEAVELAIETCPETLHAKITETKESLKPLRQAVCSYIATHQNLQELNRLPQVKSTVIKVVPVSDTVVKQGNVEKDTAVDVATMLSGDLTKIASRFGSKLDDMRDFVAYLLSPTVGPEGRRLVRNVVGQSNIFDLKNGLARLCSEEAFRSIP